MKTAKTLRNDLSDVFDELRAGSIKPAIASELANVAGKMISSARAQVAYYAASGAIPRIEFLEEEERKDA